MEGGGQVDGQVGSGGWLAVESASSLPLSMIFQQIVSLGHNLAVLSLFSHWLDGSSVSPRYAPTWRPQPEPTGHYGRRSACPPYALVRDSISANRIRQTHWPKKK